MKGILISFALPLLLATPSQAAVCKEGTPISSKATIQKAFVQEFGVGQSVIVSNYWRLMPNAVNLTEAFLHKVFETTGFEPAEYSYFIYRVRYIRGGHAQDQSAYVVTGIRESVAMVLIVTDDPEKRTVFRQSVNVCSIK